MGARGAERVELSDRDRALFHGLFEARVMLREQIAELYFAGSYDAAAKRLQKLLRFRYVRERKLADWRGTFRPSTIALGEPGFGALKAAALIEDELTWEAVRRRLALSMTTLAHDLGVVDLWVSFAKAVRGSRDRSLEHFSTWPYRYQIETAETRANGRSNLLPDAFAILSVIDDPGLPPIESPIFVEWDRSTEGRAVIRAKAEGYDHFYRSGTFAERCGGMRAPVADYPFRVVFAVKNEERRNNLLEELARPSAVPLIGDQFWSTTWAEILHDPFGAIYLHVDDYRVATEGTRYDPRSFVTTQRAYHRDQLVRERAVKRRLLD